MVEIGDGVIANVLVLKCLADVTHVYASGGLERNRVGKNVTGPEMSENGTGSEKKKITGPESRGKTAIGPEKGGTGPDGGGELAIGPEKGEIGPEDGGGTGQ